jgi:hypothetical protein
MYRLVQLTTMLLLVAADAARAADPSPAALLEAVATCAPGEPLATPPGCEARSALTRDYSKRFAAYDALAGRFLDDASPNVRAFAVRILGDRLVNRKGDLATLLSMLTSEQDGRVREAIVRTLADWASDAAVGAALLGATDDADAGVRFAAYDALTSRFGRAVPGGFEKVLAAVDHDAHPSVRQNLCMLVGKFGDDRALPVLEAHVRADASELAASCLWGIVSAWTDASKPSRAAFDLTLRLVERAQRAPGMKYFLALTPVSSVFLIVGLKAYQSRAPWFDVARLRAAMLDLSADALVDVSSRLVALGVVAHTDPSHAELAPVLAAYASASSADDREVLKRAQEIDQAATH